jgi:transposase InsO family protein
MRSLVKHNNGINFILTVIDVFCKKAWAIPLKDKKAETIINAFRSIFKERKPVYLPTDKGKEFVATSVQTYLKHSNVKFYTTNNPDKKASVVERFNRTLKTKMWKYFTHANTYKFVDILEHLVYAYNHSIHTAINMAPDDINNDNQLQVDDYIYSGRGR